MNPLNSIKGVWAAGIILAIVLAIIVNLIAGAGLIQFNSLTFVRWVHIIAGITWVGLLYYFNFVQMPAVAKAGADSGGPGPAAINKYVAPIALLWFRWAAVVTWVAGFVYLGMTRQLANVFSLGITGSDTAYGLPMGLGVWLGTIMLFNVWVLIWPNQKKVLGMVQVNDEEKARARKIATLTSRTNVMLSIPMLLFMVAGRHGIAF